ncbi:hypothetical protein KU306_02325 [Haloferax larsenii]|uniref:SPW repeat-containing protein n=1 Tax=Haloferax larsenii TaxID=302484 RepID=A0ABY5RGQ0_HALLR|nr:hypothetical protein [Haloferax larsenii]UVE50747.1 hypothetical protein KU306_02325 [Haloferax larsenii]
MLISSHLKRMLAASLSGGLVLYSFIALENPAVGLPGVAGIVTAYTTWRNDEATQAAVLVAFWVVLGILLWSPDQVRIVSSVAAVCVAYFGWYGLRGASEQH